MHIVRAEDLTSSVVPILGMHRSCTSMFTRMLSVLGLDLGGPLQRPAEDNRKGFWEHRFFQAVNMRLLSSAGCDPDAFDTPEKLSEVAVGLSERLPEALLPLVAKQVGAMSAFPVWGFKDPRTVVTYPFWIRSFARLGLPDVRPIVLVRSPASCLASLRKRGDFRKRNLTPEQEYELVLGIWLTYHELMNAYFGDDTPVVLQRDLLDESAAEGELLRCARHLGLDPRRVPPALATIERGLLTTRPEDEAPLGVPVVDALYEAFVARAEAQKRAFDALRSSSPLSAPAISSSLPESRCCIYVVSKEGYPHSRAFDDHALELHRALRELGIVAPIVTHDWEIEGTPIVLGANLAPRFEITLPPSAILYNLEQVEIGSAWMDEAYLALLRAHRVWDYSARNVEVLTSMGVPNVRLAPIGLASTGRETPTPRRDGDEDIDVLFYGSLNERREAVLKRLEEAGAKVTFLFGIYGPTRDAFVRRAKVVLNVHYYEAKVFEIVRVAHLLANGACVVSERGNDPALEAPFEEGIAFADYGEIVDRTLALLTDPAERSRLAVAGHRAIGRRDQAALLREAVSIDLASVR